LKIPELQAALSVQLELVEFGADNTLRDDILSVCGSLVTIDGANNAIVKGYTDIVRSLLDRGAKIKRDYRCHDAPLVLAVKNGQIIIVQLLLLLDRGSQNEWLAAPCKILRRFTR
jgi:ankyrin repeat protein